MGRAFAEEEFAKLVSEASCFFVVFGVIIGRSLSFEYVYLYVAGYRAEFSGDSFGLA